jgi:D-3-phosphoglycerate dehydrogenase / 2-oxoglutarate reductase
VTASRLVVAVLGEIPGPQLDVLRAGLPGAEVRQAGAHPDAVSGASWILSRNQPVDADVLDAAGPLRGVISLGADRGTIDEQACAARGVPVHAVTSPALATVAEHTLMLILMLIKRAEEAIRRLRAGLVAGGVEPALTTQESYAYNWVGLERFEGLRGQTVGLVGLGVIGGKTAHLLRAFGADVAYTKPRRLAPEQEQAAGVRFLPLPDLLSQSRCVSLHNRFTPETERMMGEREFARMPKGSFFVNTARGRLVDEDALAAALERGHLAGAALDVFWYEPLPRDSRLLNAPNLILTPHIGGIPLAESQLIELRDAARLIAREAA